MGCAEADIRSEINPHDVRTIRTMSKFWIFSFAAFAASIGYEALEEGLPKATINPSDTITLDIIEVGLDIGLAAGVIIPEAIAIAGCAEMIRIHKVATKRLEEL